MVRTETARSYLVSVDFVVAAALGLLLWWALPPQVSLAFAKDVYGVGISVLSIVFSLYFASLAVIVSSGDDEFVFYLSKHGHYETLSRAFRWCLVMLFASLSLAIVLYVVTSYQLTVGNRLHPRGLFVAFGVLSTYALLVSMCTALDSVQYARYRAKYLEARREVAERAASAKPGSEPKGVPQ
ncbi:MAG TPA: hypothetical protein VGN26_12555 [Armatimonadota bacterium]|jgi:hypothetical protein